MLLKFRAFQNKLTLNNISSEFAGLFIYSQFHLWKVITSTNLFSLFSSTLNIHEFCLLQDHTLKSKHVDPVSVMLQNKLCILCYMYYILENNSYKSHKCWYKKISWKKLKLEIKSISTLKNNLQKKVLYFWRV